MLDDAWRAESESWVDHEGGEEEGGDSEVLRPNFTVHLMMREWNQGFKAWPPASNMPHTFLLLRKESVLHLPRP
jgi:hypothetical protein